MSLLIIDANAFLLARVVLSTYHFPDGSAHNADAMWWRRSVAAPGATWSLEFVAAPAGGPAVVDDFGDLVLAEVRP